MDYYMDEELDGWLHLKSQWTLTQKESMASHLCEKKVTSGVPQECKVWPTLLNIFINNTGNGTGYAFCKSAGDSKLCSAIDSLKGRADIKMDFDRPEKWDHLMRFSWSFTVPNAMSGTWAVTIPRLGDERLRNGPTEKDWQVLEDKSLDYCICNPECHAAHVSWDTSKEFGQQVKRSDSVPLLPFTSWHAYWSTMPCSGVHSARH